MVGPLGFLSYKVCSNAGPTSVAANAMTYAYYAVCIVQVQITLTHFWCFKPTLNYLINLNYLNPFVYCPVAWSNVCTKSQKISILLSKFQTSIFILPLVKKMCESLKYHKCANSFVLCRQVLVLMHYSKKEVSLIPSVTDMCVVQFNAAKGLVI